MDTANTVPTPNKRVLVVEDEDAHRYMLRRALSLHGFDVVTAAGYLKALEVVESDQRIDLLITDIVMSPGVNGFALARMAKMRRPTLKIMYVTAFEVPVDEALGTVLRKPISDDQLIEEVRATLAA